MSVCGDRGRSMKLALHRAGDHGGNAFPISSSSCSSSSSSSCLGESSPESLRSLSCRSGGPPVYDVLEVTLAADVVLSGWSPEEDGRHGDGDEEVSTGRERPPSGDTSLSVYLDADGPGEPGDPWNQNLTLALKTQDGSHGNGGGVSSERRRGSSTPDSDSTEIPADEEDEGLFVSVSSDLSGRPEQDRAGPARLPQSGPQRSGGPEDHSVASWAPPEEPGSGPGSGSDPAPRPGSDPSGSSAVATPIRDAKRVPKPDMKAVQARGGTRGHAPRLNTPPQVRAVRTALGPSPGPVKVAVLRRPVRGRSGPAPPRKGAVLGRALSDGAGGSVHARGKAVHDAGEEVTRPAREEKGGAAGGPAGRVAARGAGGEAGAAAGPGAGPPGLQQVQSEASQNQTVGVPGPSTPAQSPAAANRQPAPGSVGRPAPPTASRLPVKGLTSSDDAAARKGPPAPPELQGRSSGPPSGRQSPTKPPAGIVGAARTRAPSLQARTPAAGLKAPTNHSAAKTAAVVRPVAALGRSGSVQPGRPGGSVDRKRPREAPPRAAAAAGQPPELVPDAVMANAPPVPVPAAVPVLPAPADATRTRAGPRASPKTGPRPQRPSRLGGGGAPGPTAVDGSAAAKRNQNKEEVERRSRAVSQLRRLLLQGNRRVEALATVIQHLLHTREEALRQKKEASLQLEELRQELARSARRCQRLQEEGEEERRGSEEAVRRLQEEHREELAQLEDRLRRFYQTEWDRVQQVYQEEAERCRRLVEQQVEELRSRQEVQRRNQEVSHSQEVESLRRQHEASVEELKKLQQVELEELRRTLKETETALMEQLSALSAEKEELNQQLRSEEERRQRLLADRTLDPHTIYLEQELESLKVVLEIKSNQLHQKDKKLVEMDKLVETKVKLEEQLKKVQQENEDYRARMDKHAALSKQLSSEQAALQQTLQQESKVNKRLSMENEELLWRLHHAHLLDGPAHRHSPTSAFGSPRNSASFPSAAPLSPR